MLKTRLLNIFIITLVGGVSMLEFKILGINFYAFRAVLFTGLAILMIKGELKLFNNKATKFAFIFLIVWLLYSCLSVFWCLDKVAAYKDIMYLIIGISVFIFLVSIKHDYKEFEKDLLNIWSRVFVVVIIFSIWEIYTGIHLSSSFTERLHELRHFHKLNFIPVFTFDNANHFAIYICFSSALYIGNFIRESKLIIFFFLSEFCIYLLNILSARLGLILYGFYGLLACVYFISINKKKRFKDILLSIRNDVFTLVIFFAFLITTYILFLDFASNRSGFVLFGFLGLIITIDYLRNNKKINIKTIWNSFAKQLIIFLFMGIGIFGFHKVENVNNETIKRTPLKHEKILSSNIIRKNLILNGYDFFIESKGLGVGAGNYMKYTQLEKGVNETNGVDSPHNWFIEIISQYGIIIGILFISLFIYIFKVIYYSIKKIGFSQIHLLVLLLILCYLVMSNANSIFMPLPINWLIFSLIILHTDDLLEIKVEDITNNKK